MEHAARLLLIRCCSFAMLILGTSAAVADARRYARLHPYQPLAERERFILDAGRMQGSPESRELHRLPRGSSAPAARPLTLAKGHDHAPVAGHTARWEMLDFCPDRGFAPDVRDCPAGWQRMRVDIGP